MAEERIIKPMPSPDGGTLYAIVVDGHPRWAFASQAAAEEALDLPTEECVALQLAANARSEAQGKKVGCSSLTEARAQKTALGDRITE